MRLRSMTRPPIVTTAAALAGHRGEGRKDSAPTDLPLELRFLGVLDPQLEALGTVLIVDPQRVSGAYALGQRLIAPEHDRVVAPAGARKSGAEVFVSDKPLALDRELVGEARRRETLAPYFGLERARELERGVLRLERAVGRYRRGERCRVAHLAHRVVKGSGEAVDVARAQAQARGRRMPAEAEQKIRRALRHEIEHVAQVQPGNRAAGAAGKPIAGRRERDDRTMVAVLEPPGEQPDHALVPGRVVEHETRGLAHGDPGDERVGIALHRFLHLAALAVQAVQLAGDIERARVVVGRERLDPDAHIGQTAGGVYARAEGEPDVQATRPLRVAAGNANGRPDPR